MKSLIQVKSHLEIIRDLVLFIIHKLCQALENKGDQFDDNSSRVAQYECNHSVWCSHHCPLGALFCKWHFNPLADDEQTWICLMGLKSLWFCRISLGTNIFIQGSLHLNQGGRNRQKVFPENFQEDLLEEMTILSHGLLISTSRSLTPPLTRADGCGESWQFYTA